MLNEGAGRRASAPCRYRYDGSTLILPRNAWNGTLVLLQKAGRRESCVFWYGTRDNKRAQVLGAIAPRQKMSWGNYHVEPDAMSEMVDLLPEGWRPLAQIHSHPGRIVEHSRYDDEMVSSKRILSIVFPRYGLKSWPWPYGVGVHEYQSGYWHRLSFLNSWRRVRIGRPADLLIEDLRR